MSPNLTLYAALVLYAAGTIVALATLFTREKRPQHIALGMMIVFQWPVSSLWAVGTMVGAGLVCAGITRIVIAATARQAVKHFTPAEEEIGVPVFLGRHQHNADLVFR